MSGIKNYSIEELTQVYHLNNVQQLAVFYTGNNNIYGINIAKIKAFIITEEVDITDTPTSDECVMGIATIRGTPVTLINLDMWLNKNPLPLHEYKLIIFCEFNNHQIGFLVKDVIDIIEKTTKELNTSEEKNSKITYTTYVEVNNLTKLCIVFNAEQLLVDIGWTQTGVQQISTSVYKQVSNNKAILVAEDSMVAREVLIQFFQKIGAAYEIYDSGKELIERLSSIDPNEIGVIITDIEMPETDGFQVTQYIKRNPTLKHIPIIINSSMTTTSVRNNIASLGVNDFIGKTDIKGLYSSILKYLGYKS